MYQHSYIMGNRWQNKLIDAKSKNNHRRSRDKISRKSSNSLKQEFRNEKFNLQLFNRLYANKTYKQYSLEGYLKYDNIYDDYDMILKKNFVNDINDDESIIDNWQCCKCSYINIERLSYCKICGNSYHENINFNYDHTIYSPLSSYVLNTNTKKNRVKRKKISKKFDKNSFKFNDSEYKQFKKYMKKRKTSIIAYKKESNNDNVTWNRKKKEKQQNNAKELFVMYQRLYLSKNKNKDEISSIINQMTAFIPRKYLKCVLQQNECKNTVCNVCYCDTADYDDMELIQMQKYCDHCMICNDCFVKDLMVKIRDDENILPWLLCPALECKAPIHIDLLLRYLSIDNLYKFGQSFVNKHLQRCLYWIECPDKNDIKCKFGWIVIKEDNINTKGMIELKCELCGCYHQIEQDEIKDNGDNIFSSMIESGLMKTCPQCDYPAIKDYGLCNVMQCGKCRIFWNWRTKDIGNSSNEVKQQARNNGTLWEPGELSYQQNLQTNDLPKFIALLAKNGIKYDPNYRRGS